MRGHILTTTSARKVPIDNTITIEQLNIDPYSIYRRLRAQSPVLRINSIERTMITKAADTKYVKDNPELFSSDDPTTPMQRAFRAKTLMRKDGEEHQCERNAMAPSFTGRNIKTCLEPLYVQIAKDFIDSLPRGETVDLFQVLAGPFAANCLKHLLGIPEVNDDDMIRWSQVLIDGAGNFGEQEALFQKCDAANDEMDALFEMAIPRLKESPDSSALSVMINAENPIAKSQIFSNIKIAIGGGINEPRDALLTILYGLLTNPDQMEAANADTLWSAAFDEGIRWVAPIQASSRRATQDTTIGGYAIAKDEVIMTVQASACHDEELYENPELFDIFRKKQPHQAFGNGPHFCQGTHVARRMLATIMLPMLFDRFPNMTLPDPDAVRFYGFGFRGPLALPVTLNT